VATGASAWRMHRTAISQAAWVQNLTGGGVQSVPTTQQGGSHPRTVAEGRLAARPGAEVTVSAETAGRIVRMLVEERASVHKGDLIAELDTDEQRAAVAEAAARLSEIDADIRYFEPKLARAHAMGPGAFSVVEVEQWTRDLEAARARRAATLATIDRLNIVVAKGQIRAPIDGTVIGRYANAGQMVEPAARIATIADLTQTRLEAEVNEFDIDGMAPGCPATVTAEGYPGRTWRAKVEEIPDVVAGRQLRPQDPGHPSDTGIVLVKLVFLEPAPFRLAQRVEVTIEARQGE
jgi:HlyD family secretion protein